MFEEDVITVANTASKKVSFLSKNPAGYFVSSMLAGLYVGLAILLIFTIGGLLSGQAYTKVVMGAAFGGALSLVVMAGAELFTGNNLVMALGLAKKTVKLNQVLALWGMCLLGNWIGSAVVALLFVGAGLASGTVGEFIASASAAKMAIPIGQLFLRGVLCNIAVCLAIWCSFRCKSESGKLIMIFWCLFIFITVGMEHSIANMTLLTIGMLKPFSAAVSLGGYFYNILVVVLGNMAGGILFVALPYSLIAQQKEN